MARVTSTNGRAGPSGKSAWERALDALSRRSLTLREVAGKLEKADHAASEVDDVLERLRRLKFVDDAQVAYNHAQRRAEEGRRGPQRVRAELLSRGVDPALADEAIADAFPADDARDRIRRAAAKLAGSRGIPTDRAGRAKLARRLARAGFPVESVSAWLEERGDDEPPP
jgi:regulatory protein